MIYIEFIERDRFMPIEIFRRLGDQSAWTDAADALVGSFGRTLRLGPMPSYLAFWRCKGMARLDEWEAHFRSAAATAEVAERATHQAIHLQRGGCYDELVMHLPVDRDGLFCLEFFSVPAGFEDETVTRHFAERARRHPQAMLSFVLRGIGRLTPDPGSIAVWTFADYVALEPFERGRPHEDPFRPTEVGLYRWFGREVL